MVGGVGALAEPRAAVLGGTGTLWKWAGTQEPRAGRGQSQRESGEAAQVKISVPSPLTPERSHLPQTRAPQWWEGLTLARPGQAAALGSCQCRGVLAALPVAQHGGQWPACFRGVPLNPTFPPTLQPQTHTDAQREPRGGWEGQHSAPPGWPTAPPGRVLSLEMGPEAGPAQPPNLWF